MSEPLTTEKQLSRRVKETDPRYDARTIERIMARVTFCPSGCWRFGGTHTPTGYGVILYRGVNNNAHRIMYQLTYGVKLDHFQYVLHSCDVYDCVNPAHLRPGTPLENMQEKNARGRNFFSNRTHCPYGHPYDAQNTYVFKGPNGRPRRNCKTCQRERHRRAA